MNIDLHAHLMVLEALTELHAAYPELAPVAARSGDGYRLSYPGRPPMGPIPESMFSPALRLAEMDAMRVDLQVVAVPPPQFLYHLPIDAAANFSRVQNDAALTVSAAHPDRIQVFATLPLQDPAAAVKEVGRVAGQPLVRGVQVGTNVDGVDLDSPELDPVWTVLADAGLPVWVHPDQRSVAGAERLARYYLVNLIGNPLETTIAVARLIFGGVLDRHPRLRFGFVHGGGFVPYQVGRWDHGLRVRGEPREHIQAAPSGYLSRMWFDSLTHDAASLRLLGERVGWSQVVLGSDYPFDMGAPRPVDAVERAGLPPGSQAGVLGGNVGAFLRPG